MNRDRVILSNMYWIIALSACAGVALTSLVWALSTNQLFDWYAGTMIAVCAFCVWRVTARMSTIVQLLRTYTFMESLNISARRDYYAGDQQQH